MSSRKEYYVEYPANDRTGNNPQNTRNKSNYVFIRYTLDNAVDCPDYIEHGKRKNDFENERKFVHRLDKTFHIYRSFRRRLSAVITLFHKTFIL